MFKDKVRALLTPKLELPDNEDEFDSIPVDGGSNVSREAPSSQSIESNPVKGTSSRKMGSGSSGVKYDTNLNFIYRVEHYFSFTHLSYH